MEDEIIDIQGLFGSTSTNGQGGEDGGVEELRELFENAIGL